MSERTPEQRLYTARRKISTKWMCISVFTTLIILLGIIAFAIRSATPSKIEYRPDTTPVSLFAQIGKVPHAGDVFLHPHYKQTLDRCREKHDLFLIGFYLFADNGSPATQDETLAESERLATLGYRIYRENDAKAQDDNEIIGVFSSEELEDFSYNDDYGYIFAYVAESGWKVNWVVDESLRVQG